MMDENFNTIKREIEEFRNTIVLVLDKAYVLRGFELDEDPLYGDYFYVLQDIKGEFESHSWVGGFIPLKNSLPQSDYERIKNYFEVNLKRIAESISIEVK